MHHHSFPHSLSLSQSINFLLNVLFIYFLLYLFILLHIFIILHFFILLHLFIIIHIFTTLVVVPKNESSVAYGSYDLVNKKLLIDGVDVCDFLYLGAFFKVFSLSIVLSILHIFKDCFEHQAAFTKELQAYKESANKELDAIFSPYLPKKQ